MCKFGGKPFSPTRTAYPLRGRVKEEVDKWQERRKGDRQKNICAFNYGHHNLLPL